VARRSGGLLRGIATRPVRIAVVGTLQVRKRQLEVVKAVGLLRKAGYDVELNLYGYALAALSEYIAGIDVLIEAAGLGGRVRRHGYVDDPGQITRENEIVLSASTDESLPQGLLFQMYEGLIGVAVLSGGIDEVVTDGRNGYLTQDPTPSGIAAALARSIEDRDRWCGGGGRAPHHRR
jgi:glycosyltransferase involved in cell wall biosynthesis